MVRVAWRTASTVRYIAIAIVALSVGVPLHRAANAQFKSHYTQGLNLSREDIDLLNDAAGKVAEEPVGSIEAWANPNSGNSGTIRFAEMSEQDGLPCRTLEHAIRHKGVADLSTFVARRCKLPNGEWKLY